LFPSPRVILFLKSTGIRIKIVRQPFRFSTSRANTFAEPIQEWTTGTPIPEHAIHTKEETLKPKSGPYKGKSCTVYNMYCEMDIKGFKDAPDTPDGKGTPTKYDLQNQFAHAVANSNIVMNDHGGTDEANRYSSPNKGALVVTGHTDENGRSRVNNIPVGEYNKQITDKQVHDIQNDIPNAQAQKSKDYMAAKVAHAQASKKVSNKLDRPTLKFDGQNYHIAAPTEAERADREKKLARKEKQKAAGTHNDDDASSIHTQDSRMSQLSRTSSISSISSVSTNGDASHDDYMKQKVQKVGKKAQHHAEDASDAAVEKARKDPTNVYKTRVSFDGNS